MIRLLKKYKLSIFALITLMLLGAATINISYEEHSELDGFLTTNLDLNNKKILGNEPNEHDETSPLESLTEKGQKWLSQYFNIWRLYQNLANPTGRYVVLNSGLRKEEVAEILSNELKWHLGNKLAFISADQSIDKTNKEGRYHPGGYLFPISTKPKDAYETIMRRFNQEIESRYATSTANIINIDVALRIASIIEREAAGKKDMKLISGIIWNRIFKNMNLEMDATLQYAKGNNQKGWWPPVSPKDKYIDSPYNTYQNKGLPPTPISNVSMAALNAALNPHKTNCIFYLHDKHGNIHCSATYKGHKANIKKYYGV